MKELYKTDNYLEPMLLLEYEIEAKREDVYNAWLDLKIFRKWFCPTGFSITKAELVPETGGYFRIHMQSPGGDIYPTKGEYILLKKPNRIVYKDSWDDDRQDNQAITTEILFKDLGDNTKLIFYSSFATEDQKVKVLGTDIISGWKMFLNNLNNVLTNQE